MSLRVSTKVNICPYLLTPRDLYLFKQIQRGYSVILYELQAMELEIYPPLLPQRWICSLPFKRNSLHSPYLSSLKGSESDPVKIRLFLYQLNLIRVLVYRAFHIFSTYFNFQDEIVRIKGILKETPSLCHLLTAFIKTFLDKQFSKKPPPTRDEKQFIMFCLPFLGSYSLRVETKLTRLFKQCYPDVKLNVIFNSPKRLSSYVF